MNKIRLESGTEFDCSLAISSRRDMRDRTRDVIALTLMNTTIEEVIAAFVDDISYSLLESYMVPTKKIIQKFNPEDPTEVIDEEIIEDVEHFREYDKSEYDLHGDIIKHPDDSITVIMGKHTEDEDTIIINDKNYAALLFELLTGEEFDLNEF